MKVIFLSIKCSCNKAVYSYLWSSLETDSAIKITSPGLYFVKVSNGNCTSIDSINITNCPLNSFFIPTSFSPNGDGKNDVFSIYGINIKKIIIIIFNRWGELISASEDMTKAWDGTSNGKPSPEGVFVYSINATDSQNVVVSQIGKIVLIR